MQAQFHNTTKKKGWVVQWSSKAYGRNTEYTVYSFKTGSNPRLSLGPPQANHPRVRLQAVQPLLKY